LGTRLVGPPAAPARPWGWLAAGGLLLLACGALTALSFSFRPGEGYEERPIAAAVAILVAAGAVYFVAVLRAFRAPPPLSLVLVFSILFRLVLVPSAPIQENDIYRYIWDGKVVAAGLDPYRASPREVEEAVAAAPEAASEPLAALSRLARRSPAHAAILARINHPEQVTIYPAPAQWLFAVPGALVPAGAPLHLQVTAMKAFLALFDLATLAVLAILLARLGKPPALALLYGWCPLVLKELANSGHMDSIPTFFLMASLVAFVRAAPDGARAGSGPGGWGAALLAGCLLGAAVASKLFAALVLPLCLRRLSLGRALAAFAACAAVIAASQLAYAGSAERRAETLIRFALGWENNAALFFWMERLLAALIGGGRWSFELAGLEWSVVASTALARAVAAGAIAAAALALAWRTNPETSPVLFLRRAFLSLAALFLIGPLGFPWYFVWCVPLLPFARARSWFLLPALLMVYYLRFWFQYRHQQLGFPSEESALQSFDSVVVTAEFALFFLALGLETVYGKWRKQLDGS
jgi:hypothetical protein